MYFDTDYNFLISNCLLKIRRMHIREFWLCLKKTFLHQFTVDDAHVFLTIHCVVIQMLKVRAYYSSSNTIFFLPVGEKHSVDSFAKMKISPFDSEK